MQKDSAEQLKAGWVNAGKISHISCYFHLSSKNAILKTNKQTKPKPPIMNHFGLQMHFEAWLDLFVLSILLLY